MPGHLACQISGWYIYFWQTYSPKTVSVDDVIFSNSILSILRHRREIKILFWNPKINLVNIHISFIRKTQFENLTLCDPGLTRPFPVVDLYGVWLQNGLNFLILRAIVTINHVPHARKRIFDSCDLSWHDLFPEPYLVWHLCPQGIVTSLLM